MKRIRNAHYGWLVAGAMLLGPGLATAQKRLPIGDSTVPPIDGSTTGTGSQLPQASDGGGRGSNGASLGGDDGTNSTVKRNMESMRFNLANVERQRALTREATQLLQMTAELQVKLASNAPGMSQAEMLKQIDTIEKLARNVKERMKGTR